MISSRCSVIRRILPGMVMVLMAGCGTVQTVLVDQDIATTNWIPSSSAWTISDSSITADTRTYDDLLAAPVFVTSDAPWSLEVDLMGERAGVFFCLDDTLSKRSSHMVRFDGQTVLAGYFNGGGDFTATSVFASPSSPRDRVRLRVDVDPISRTYAIRVDGSLVGVDTTLLFRSGYTGLQASAGTSSFRSYTVVREGSSSEIRTPRIGETFELAHVRHIEAHGSVPCVFDPLSRVWVMIDSNGKVLRTHLSPVVRNISAETAGRVFTLSGTTMYVYDADRVLIDSSHGRFGSPEALVAHDRSVFVADSKVNAVLEFDEDGSFVRYHDAALIGGFLSPRGLAVLESGEIAVADYDKIVLLDPYRSPPSIDVVHDSRSSVKFERDDGFPIDTLFLTSAGRNVAVSMDPSGAASFRGLEPNRTYTYRYGPVLTTIPPSAGMSRQLAFTTPPENPNLRQYRKLDLLYLIYRTISYRDVYPESRYPTVPDGRTLTDDEIAYLHTAAAFNTEFFFRNSSCRLLLTFDIHVIEDTLWLSDVGNADPYWLEPNERVAADVRAAAASFGKDPASYDGTICTYAWLNHPPRRTSALRDPSVSLHDSVRIRQAYGGGTYGVPAPWAYGTTSGYTGNPFQDTFSRQDWLITHEFHHQLDALMYASGFPEYHHADQPWTMAGAFGEDFNFNASIIREASPESWLAVSFGTLETFADLDGDGLPDDDPSLPFDERRLGADANVWDTDGDNLSDLDEVTAGTERGTSVSNTDTDGDGLWDSEDPEPLYPYPTDIGIIEPDGRLQDFAIATLGGIRTEIFAGWSGDSLAFEIHTSKPANVLFQLDGTNDGWFHGFENIQLRIRNTPDSVYVEEYYLRDCSSWVDPPQDRRDILHVDELRLTTHRIRIAGFPDLSRDVIRFVIPANPAFGLEWKEGHEISIRFGIQTTNDRWVWNELFERNDMMTLILR